VPSTNRQRGDYLERQTRAALESFGWIVYRSAGSMGLGDLVAMRSDMRPLIVQCKINGRIDPGERAELVEQAAQAGARPILACRSKRGYVDIHLVRPEGKLIPPIDQLRVPMRPGKKLDEDGDDAT
jgi:Holliday junction resolvase